LDELHGGVEMNAERVGPDLVDETLDAREAELPSLDDADVPEEEDLRRPLPDLEGPGAVRVPAHRPLTAKAEPVAAPLRDLRQSLVDLRRAFRAAGHRGDHDGGPEPLPENLTDLSKAVIDNNAQLGIVVDPDVDRLAFVCEDGSLFGEEYTLVAVSDYILGQKPGPAVSNLSSTRALRDVTDKKGLKYHASAVGEVNVVNKMKEVGATIGGEGNGGVILPDLHYGRDALAGIALFLSHLATQTEGNASVKELRNGYTSYFMSKNKIQLTPEINVDSILKQMEERYKAENTSTVDGLKIDFENEWVHLRKSNTEPIIRIYAESMSDERAQELTNGIIQEIKSLIN